MPRDLILISISLFTWGVGEGLFIYFQSLYLEQWGANPVEIGAILSMMGIAMAVVQAPAGYLADRIGSRPVMWGSWILGTAAAVMMAMAGSLSMFVAGLLTYGLTSFVVAPMNSYITSVRGKWSVERALTVVSAIYHFGAVIGPIIGGVLAESMGLQAIYRISAGIFMVSTVIVLNTRRAPIEKVSEAHAEHPKLTANPRFMGLLALIFITMFALYLPQPLTANYLQNEHNITLGTIGILGAVGSLGNALIMLGLGHLSAPIGLLAGELLVGLFALIMWKSSGVWLFGLGYFFMGGYRLSRSMALAYARSLVKPNETGFAYGLVETGNAVSVIAAPLVAGFLYDQNPQSVYSASLVIIGLVMVVNFLQLPARPGKATAQPAADILNEGK